VTAVSERYEALKFKWAPYDMDYRLRHRNGHWVWIRDCAISAYERNGVVYFAGVLIDITTRKQAELEVQQQHQLLAHLTRVATLGELSGALAHDLSQPLTSILTNAQAALQFLAREPVDLAEVRDILNDIVDADRRAGEFIRRLRALLRRGETPRQPLDVNDVTTEVLRLLHSELVAQGVTVTTQMTPGLPKVHGDSVALQQVLLNLIVNACDAMRLSVASERRIAITTALDDASAVRVAITDRGAGVHGGGRRLAGRGQRAGVRAVLHHEGARPRSGTGHLPVDRRRARRTPLRHQQCRPWGHVLVHLARLERGGGMTSAPTVFVVDDDPSVLRALERLFRGAGWPVRTFASAEEFLRHDLHVARGCLVADVHLGRMSGLELHAPLGRRPRRMPVILTSGVDDVNMEAEAFRLGALAFFRKPFEATALLDCVRRGLAAD